MFQKRQFEVYLLDGFLDDGVCKKTSDIILAIWKSSRL